MPVVHTLITILWAGGTYGMDRHGALGFSFPISLLHPLLGLPLSPFFSFWGVGGRAPACLVVWGA